jgi:serine/threonine protein kinase/tetratricopeptide (TPR) repeat protein
MTSCPSSDKLAALLAEQLALDEVAGIEAHVEVCPRCQSLLDDLSGPTPQRQPDIEPPLDPASSLLMSAFLDRLKSNSVIGKPGEGAWKTSDAVPGPGLPQVAGYEILGEIGRGGMGVVFKARHLGLNRVVALKMLSTARFASVDAHKRFHQEAQAIARLDHPNIIHIYDVGATPDGPYFSLEYVETGSLAKRLEGTPQGARDSARLVEQLARAVQAAHQRGILHRDLKPGNVLLAPLRQQAVQPKGPHGGLAEFEPKISDFGLAKHLVNDPSSDQGNDQTQSGMVVGTPSYMAPEQAAGQSRTLGPAVDIYALGAILYEMLTGRPPFRAATVLETLVQVRTLDPVSVNRLQPDVPLDLGTICSKCIHKDPEQRYATAADLADDLRRFLAGEPIIARPPGRIERTIKWSRRHPLATTLVVVTGLLLLIGGAAANWYDADQKRRTAEVVTEVNRLHNDAISTYGQARGAGLDLALWASAVAAAEKADAVADARNAPQELRTQLANLLEEIRVHQKNQRLIATLHDIQASMGDDLQANADQDFPKANARYSQAFSEFGITRPDALPAAELADALRALGESVQIELAAALDVWGYVRMASRLPLAQRRFLHDASRLIDPDPKRNRLRDALIANNRKEILAIAAALDPMTEPVQFVNLIAAWSLYLAPRGQFAEETEFLRRAQECYPKDFQINHNLAFCLLGSDHAEEAIPFARAATTIRDQSATAWQVLADSQRIAGRDDDAVKAHQRAAKLAPRLIRHLAWWGFIADSHGNKDLAIAAFREAARRIPRQEPRDEQFFSFWRKYELIDEAIGEYRNVISEYSEHDPKSLPARLGLCRLLYLDQRFPEVTNEYQRVLAIEQKADYYFWQAAALGGQGRYREAIAQYNRCLALDPKHPSAASWRDDTNRNWVREQHFPEILSHPTPDAEELFALAHSFQRWSGRYRDAVTVCTMAFAADPKRITLRTNFDRYNAACCAALAAAGVGDGADKLDGKEKSALRQRALGWLKEDLALRAQWVAEDAQAAFAVESQLRIWLRDKDLATVRGEQALLSLPDDERADWASLWSEVERRIIEARSRYKETVHRGYLGVNRPQNEWAIKLTAGTSCQIDMESHQFPTVLRLEDEAGNTISDGVTSTRSGRDSQLILRTRANLSYRIVGCFNNKASQGAYTLTIREFAPR